MRPIYEVLFFSKVGPSKTGCGLSKSAAYTWEETTTRWTEIKFFCTVKEIGPSSMILVLSIFITFEFKKLKFYLQVLFIYLNVHQCKNTRVYTYINQHLISNLKKRRCFQCRKRHFSDSFKFLILQLKLFYTGRYIVWFHYFRILIFEKWRENYW